MKTDTSEKGLETLIMRHMTGTDGLATGSVGVVAETKPDKGGSGWFAGNAAAYDREFAVDAEQLFAFLIATQPEEWAKFRDTSATIAWTEQEYRTGLTDELVTDTLDVREAAAKLPSPRAEPGTKKAE